jgi:UDP-glucose 4-epimerase
MRTTSPTPTDDVPTIAITGAAGYIGSRIIARLQDAHSDWEITPLDNFSRGDIRSVNSCEIEYLDIRNRNRLETKLADADVVLHLAAVSGVDDCDTNADLAYEVNVQGTSNVAWFCRKSGAGLVFPYSMAVLGDPEEFPITVDQPRGPFNWYGRTKLLGERLVEDMAAESFPAHLLMKSNLYGEHEVGDQVVSKGTVINFFIGRVFAGEPLTVYEPGSQSRNFIHVDDIARAYVRSTERLLEQLNRGETGVEKYEIASSEDPSVMAMAELVKEIAAEEAGIDATITLVDNPRGNETLVEDFIVNTSKANEVLGWEPQRTVEETIRTLIRRKASER